MLMFLAMLTANLAVLNFLPIPLLDGGHMAFLIIEGLRQAGERTRRTGLPLRRLRIYHRLDAVRVFAGNQAAD